MARRTELITVRFEAADLVKESAKISSNKGVHQGQMVGFKLVMPNFVNAITATVAIKDGDGDALYTSGAQAENGVRVVMGLNIPLIERETIVITLSGTHGGVVPETYGDVSVLLYYNPDVLIP